MNNFQKKNFMFQCTIPQDEIDYPFNATLLYRAISNILSNALKYNPAGTTVQLELLSKENGIEIVIQDNGIGIPPAIEEKKYLKLLSVVIKHVKVMEVLD